LLTLSENIHVNPALPKEEKYRELLPGLHALVASETDLIANLSNMVAALQQVFSWWWCGFYIVKGEELVLGPFQGPVACTRISYGQGVCGTAWQKASPILVEDVDKFPGHIACSAASRSEIVLPVIVESKVMAVLDVDSEHLSCFDETDLFFLAQVAALAGKCFAGSR
jgi:L-methionine (R)-S-oxide reductase